MYINENYNMGLLILFHLLLVAFLKIIMFNYVIKPLIKEYMEDIEKGLPQLNEETLDKYGIYHNDALSNNFNSGLQVLIKNNEPLSNLSDFMNELYDNNISSNLKTYIETKQLEDDIENDERNQRFYYRVFIGITVILTAIVIWYIVHLKHKHVKADIPELILGNIIPLSIIFFFEIYFIKNIAIKYKVTGKHGLLHDTLKKLYQN